MRRFAQVEDLAHLRSGCVEEALRMENPNLGSKSYCLPLKVLKEQIMFFAQVSDDTRAEVER